MMILPPIPRLELIVHKTQYCQAEQGLRKAPIVVGTNNSCLTKAAIAIAITVPRGTSNCDNLERS